MPALKLLMLPVPVAESWDWQLGAACRERDAALFFHPDNERGEARDERIAAAKQICRTCPVQAQCLRHALETREPYGTWGGTTEDERRAGIVTLDDSKTSWCGRAGRTVCRESGEKIV